METRLFKSNDGNTYLFTKQVSPYDKSYYAHLRVVKDEGTVTDPLITKYVNNSTITRDNFCHRVSSKIDGSRFKVIEGDKLVLCGRLSGGKVESIDQLNIPVNKIGEIPNYSLELSPIAKRYLRKIGEFFAKIR